jgi:ATP-dependent Clp endopeptidase proteolytic subunit ClpP
MKKLIPTILVLAAVVGGLLLATSETSGKSADVVLTSKNTVTLRGPIDGGSANGVIKKLRELDEKGSAKDPIYLVLYTPGGEVMAGLDIIEYTKGMKRPVHTITMFAASMGFQTAQQLGDRLILGNGTLMSHKAAGGFEGEFNSGDDSQIDSRMKNIKALIREMDERTVARTKGKQTLESYQKAYENELWLLAKASVEKGYADKVITARCDSSLNGVETIKLSLMGIITINVNFSACPLQPGVESISADTETNKGKKKMTDFLNEGGIMGIDCTTAQHMLNKKPEELLCLPTAVTMENILSEQRKIKNMFTRKGMEEAARKF